MVERKRVHFFCRNCFNKYNAITEYEFNDNSEDDKLHTSHFVTFSYDCACGHVAEEIDQQMLDFVNKFNKMGFYTDQCCEGHSRNDGSMESGTYIKFLSTQEEYADGIHVMDEEKEKYLSVFLSNNLKYPLKWSYDNLYTKSLSIDIDCDKIDEKDLDSNYDKIKELALKELRRVVDLLEKTYTEENKGE